MDLPKPAVESAYTNGLITSIERALIDCMDALEVTHCLARTYVYDYSLRDKLLKRLAALVEGDGRQLDAARPGIYAILATDENSLPARNRSVLDATIKRLILLLPVEEQFKAVPHLVMHRRAARRRAGAAIVNAQWRFSPPEMQQTLLSAYERWHDAEVLTPLSRISTELSGIVPMLLDALSRLVDSQGTNRPLREQAYVFERLVVCDLAKAVEYSKKYPAAFIYGVGRARQQEALQVVVTLLEDALADYIQASVAAERVLHEQSIEDWRSHADVVRESAECLRLGIWALGKLQAKSVLEQLARDFGVQVLAVVSEALDDGLRSV